MRMFRFVSMSNLKTYAFENLLCWQLARQLAVWTYKITISFPQEEKFGIISQMRRAGVSIAANLAEGTSRLTKKDQAHFSSISYSSSMELLNHLIIANDLKFISEFSYQERREKIEKLTHMIASLRKSQQSNTKLTKTS